MLITSALFFLALAVAPSAFQHDAQAQVLQSRAYILIVPGDSATDFIELDTLAIKALLRRVMRMDDSTATGVAVDTAANVSFKRHDWNIGGKKVFIGQVRIIPQLLVGINDTLQQYGTFGVRTNDTARANVAAQVVDAGTRGTLMRIRNDGIVSLPNQSAARAYRSSTQSVSANVDTKVEMNSEQYDAREEHSLVNYSFHCTADGKYLIQGQVSITTAAAVENVVAVVYKNGSSYINGVVSRSSNTGFSHWTSAPVSCVLSLAAGDVIDLRLFTPSAATVQSGQGITWLEVVKIH